MLQNIQVIYYNYILPVILHMLVFFKFIEFALIIQHCCIFHRNIKKFQVTLLKKQRIF